MAWMDAVPVLILALAVLGLVSLSSALLARLCSLVLNRAPLKLSFLVVTYNQEHQIEGVVRALARVIQDRPFESGQLVVLDLSSTDATMQIMTRLVREFDEVKLVQMPADQVHRAIELGLFLCRCPVTLILDLRGAVDGRALVQSIERKWK